MKKLYTYITLLIMAVLTVNTLSSCQDDDADQAYDLNGIWQGTIRGDYYSDRFNSRRTEWITEIQFRQDGAFAKGGVGTEYDYCRYTGEESWSTFDWEVRNGMIYMYFHEDHYRIIIRDYEQYSNWRGQFFRGYFDDYRTGQSIASFDLYKVDNWTDFAKKHKTYEIEK
ncbi:hypothetical protein [Xylanibacter muris]|uniref:Lipocalin-like domain-containing protein n=1 Tax=Xylanibacter muris TaxID=2736290 RepID=A0ABX2AMC9_9BACT|nr:hypothetical protein [Xylanibacter muris]NPD91192.1 hypothetical protein [Xylanibacter muris]